MQSLSSWRLLKIISFGGALQLLADLDKGALSLDILECIPWSLSSGLPAIRYFNNIEMILPVCHRAFSIVSSPYLGLAGMHIFRVLLPGQCKMGHARTGKVPSLLHGNEESFSTGKGFLSVVQYRPVDSNSATPGSAGGPRKQ